MGLKDKEVRQTEREWEKKGERDRERERRGGKEETEGNRTKKNFSIMINYLIFPTADGV